MAAGRTNKALRVCVPPQFFESEQVKELIAKGHNVVCILDEDFVKADLILHPAAHQWNEMMWDFLPAALAAARKRKKEAKA
jgi:hypothetical protein